MNNVSLITDAPPFDPNFILINHVKPTLAEVYALHSVALVFIGASMLGSLYMIIKTVYRGKYTTIGERFPLYLSCLDLLWSISHTIDHSWYLATGGQSPPAQACAAMGGVLGLFMMAEIMLVNLLAISMFLTVYMNWSLSYGRKDWILGVLTFGVPVIFVTFGFAFQGFGPDFYWCFINTSKRTGHILLGIVLVAAIFCILLPAVCFYLIYRKVSKHNKVMKLLNKSVHDSFGGDKEKALQNKIVSRLIEYQLALVLTFTCLIAYAASIVIFRAEPLPLIFWVVISFNSNGFLNFLVFLRHEYLKKREMLSSGGSTGMSTSDSQNGIKA
ncbi:hypothetical protein HDV05_002937 [Chytridiales sp. JEL 0842]|nr:hypothetical protein HDV05_002937 [Chytridiales sp. JEL 0842]